MAVYGLSVWRSKWVKNMPQLFFECRNYFSHMPQLLAGSKTVQVSQQGRLIPGRRRLLPAH